MADNISNEQIKDKFILLYKYLVFYDKIKSVRDFSRKVLDDMSSMNTSRMLDKKDPQKVKLEYLFKTEKFVSDNGLNPKDLYDAKNEVELYKNKYKALQKSIEELEESNKRIIAKYEEDSRPDKDEIGKYYLSLLKQGEKTFTPEEFSDLAEYIDKMPAIMQLIEAAAAFEKSRKSIKN